MLYLLFSDAVGYNLNHLGVVGTYLLGANALLFPIVLALLAISAFLGYLAGSVNTAVIVSGLLYKSDIRTLGSGNAGSANMMRSFGNKGAFLTFGGDAFKTVVAAMLGWLLYGYMGGVVASLFCLIGHIFPVFYKFRGGKGVVCFGSALFVFDWRLFLMFIAIFVVSILATKYISLGSVLASAAVPLFMSKMYQSVILPGTESERLVVYTTLAAFIAAVFVVIKHLGNLKRITNGTESKFAFKKSVKTDGEENA